MCRDVVWGTTWSNCRPACPRLELTLERRRKLQCTAICWHTAMSSVCRNCGLVGRSFTSEYALACSSVWRVNVVCEAVDLWRMRLSSCQKAKGHHFEHLLNKNVFFLSHQHVCRKEHVTLRVIYVAATQKQMKKRAQRDANTAHWL